ncbi:hypothetical protein [Acinetobacter larvae]|uniref:Uncharacterized protein n=1 Tax=Acinetobacter larvae TaxID=1789224 RepID=A0A1B2LVZ4_9GAMM|nr:hypothetical protein [Acinetobacter larvae]AOA57107.1 hypothetical protein BFG52_01235 [Acinetobacter larvae]
MGVANIPAFLGATRDIPYFLNSTGLHDATIQRILQEEGLESEADDDIIQLVKQKLDTILMDTYSNKYI